MKVPSRFSIVALSCSLIDPTLLGNWLTIGTHTADAGCYKCHKDAPLFFNGYLDRAQTTPKFTRVVCNKDVPIYMDPEVRNVARSTTRWLIPFITNAWRHIKKTYGSCAVPREIFGVPGPNCENFGVRNPILCSWEWLGTDLTETPFTMLDYVLSGACAWPPKRVAKELSLSLANVFGIKTLTALCLYDLFNKTGFAADAAFEYSTQRGLSYDSPPGSTDTYFFRDWLYPLWVDSGNNMDSHVRLYELLSLHYPTKRSANGKHAEYVSQLNIGDLVHFMSAAQGRSLAAMAAAAFNTGWKPTQYATSRTKFPALSAMYA
ncbi:hypothetical protein DFS34DRAFT_593454 [Phlyctochytrium arcticum]|nr:hypothetical protein DFS34DRAFT_593454 [Phlyctochytrium arcticum]